MKSAMIYTNDFNRIIDATKQFISATNKRVVYNYIRLEFDSETSTVAAVAIDGYRMSVEHSVISNCNESFIAYIKPTVKLPSKMFADISVDDEETKIKCGDFSFAFTIPKGDFLDWQKVIPKTDVVYKICFNGNYLLSALQAAKVSLGNSFKNPVILEFRSPNEPILLRTNKDDLKMVLPVRIRD